VAAQGSALHSGQRRIVDLVCVVCVKRYVVVGQLARLGVLVRQLGTGTREGFVPVQGDTEVG
jgi:hypothetical protein